MRKSVMTYAFDGKSKAPVAGGPTSLGRLKSICRSAPLLDANDNETKEKPRDQRRHRKQPLIGSPLSKDSVGLLSHSVGVPMVTADGGIVLNFVKSSGGIVAETEHTSNDAISSCG